jgi:3-oxo-5alpha-steroid 4-dehydrogenase
VRLTVRPRPTYRHDPGGRHNHHAALGEDPDFHKSADWLAPQDQGPWAVFDLRPGHALYAGFTLGGLRTTVDAQVQRPDGSVIPRLHADVTG